MCNFTSSRPRIFRALFGLPAPTRRLFKSLIYFFIIMFFIILKFSRLSVWTTWVRLSGSTYVEWLAPFVKQIADWTVQARTEAIQRGNQLSLHIQFNGFYLTPGHCSNNNSATVHYVIWPDHLTFRHPAMEKKGVTSVAAKNELSSSKVNVAAVF